MTPQRTCLNYLGVPTEAPADLAILRSIGADGYVVWTSTRKGHRHRVRYGLQVKDFDCQQEAGREFAECMAHNLICEGIN